MQEYLSIFSKIKPYSYYLNSFYYFSVNKLYFIEVYTYPFSSYSTSSFLLPQNLKQSLSNTI